MIIATQEYEEKNATWITNSIKLQEKDKQIRKALKTHSKIPISNIYTPNKLKYIIAKGNNSQLIREAMEHRKGWIEIPNINSLYNFKWQPFSDGIKFESPHSFEFMKQMVNHLK